MDTVAKSWRREMKLSEARKILSDCAKWTFKHMGIDQDAPKMDYSLEDMIRANKIVERANKRVINRGKGGTTQMVFDERGLAALYVAMSFQPCRACYAESVAEYDGSYVFVIRGDEK